MDSDRMLVLSDGKVEVNYCWKIFSHGASNLLFKEFDSPYNLLQHPDGILSELVSHTDPATQAELRDMASAAEQTRRASNFDGSRR